MVNKTFLPPAAPPAKNLSPSQIELFRVGTAFAEEIGEPAGLGELKGLPDPVSGLGEQAFGIDSQGEIPDGEYASRRTITADDAGTADGCRRQQRRQHQYQRLQGRPVAVRGIPQLAR